MAAWVVFTRAREDRISSITHQRERTARGTEAVVGQIRSHGVEPIRLHVVEAIAAIAVGDGARVLAATEADTNAAQWVTINTRHHAADARRACRGRHNLAHRPIREYRYVGQAGLMQAHIH